MKIISLFQILFFLILIFITNCDFALDESDDARSANKLKVFILAGQSNMEGKGFIEPKQSHIDKNGGKGTLRYLYNKNKTQYKYLVNSSGNWAARKDVWLVDVSKQGALKPNFNATSIGPELQFGHELGNYYKNNNVLLIKTAWGGKSLYVNFRPPSSGGKTGENYNLMINRIKSVLGNIKKFYPAYNGQGYELVGFGWHQGWNDRVKQEAVDEYLKNCVNLVNDLRKDLKFDAMPFVIANTGMGKDVNAKAKKLMDDQMKVPNDNRLKIKKNVGAVDTRGFFIDSSQSPTKFTFHWNCNAKSYLQIGGAMAKKMIQILGNSGNEEGEDEYTLKVNKGDGDGSYSADEVVNITADPAPSGQVFKNWRVISGNPQIAQVESESTTLTMPSGNVEITAIYQDELVNGDEYTLIVNNGDGDGSYSADEAVTIIANTPLDKLFDKWVVVSGNPQIDQIDSESTTLIMPSRNVEISASYREEQEIGCGNIGDILNTNSK